MDYRHYVLSEKRPAPEQVCYVPAFDGAFTLRQGEFGELRWKGVDTAQDWLSVPTDVWRPAALALAAVFDDM